MVKEAFLSSRGNGSLSFLSLQPCVAESAVRLSSAQSERRVLIKGRQLVAVAFPQLTHRLQGTPGHPAPVALAVARATTHVRPSRPNAARAGDGLGCRPRGPQPLCS